MAEFDREGMGNVLKVALGVCLAGSILVSSAAVLLQPMQAANRELDRKQNVLRAAGVLPPGATRSADGRDANALFAEFEVRAVDLASGRQRTDVDVAAFDPMQAARDPALSSALPAGADTARIGRRENVSLVYVGEDRSGESVLVLPVRGYGLWGALNGYLALKDDLDTVAGLSFYAHKETPGLGGEVDNVAWQAGWQGVRLLDQDGRPAVRLVKLRSAAGSAAAQREVDALSGATLTSRGVRESGELLGW